jgi:hypothetical protein
MDEVMDKYAVVVEPELEDRLDKVGEHREPGTCPVCGRLVDPRSNVPYCPEHGTRPFEHTPEKR